MQYLQRCGMIIVTLCALYANATELGQLTRSFAECGRYFGSAVLWHKLSSDSAYRHYASSFAIVTPETEMKFFNIQKQRGRFVFEGADSIVTFCKKHHILVRGHTLVWANDALPDWMLKTDFPRDTLWKILKQHVTTVAKHFRGELYCWDVVNEAIDNNGKMVPNIYYEKLGENYIDSAFVWTHAADTSVRLFYNDYYTNYGHDEYKKKLELTYALISRLKRRGVRVDGLGLQMHLSMDRPIDYRYFRQYLDKFSKLNLELHFTELDVGIDTPFTDQKLRRQAEIFDAATNLFLSVPSCKAFVVWGFTDTSSWIPEYSNGAQGSACLLDTHYRPKPVLLSGINNALRDCRRNRVPAKR